MLALSGPLPAAAPQPAHEAARQLSPLPPAQAVRVIDGDTLVINGVRHRLFGIDAPERETQCFGKAGAVWSCGNHAAARLRALCVQRSVRCVPVNGERDPYGRQISRCHADGLDLSRAMVEAGLAWAFRRYSMEYVWAESAARRQGRGIWQHFNPPPWQIREQRRSREGRTDADNPR